jgi:hypothetical protein
VVVFRNEVGVMLQAQGVEAVQEGKVVVRGIVEGLLGKKMFQSTPKLPVQLVP